MWSAELHIFSLLIKLIQIGMPDIGKCLQIQVLHFGNLSLRDKNTLVVLRFRL
jgi:hypothetical protein